MTRKATASVLQRVESMLAATLIEDFTLYPRNQVDDTHISDLVRVLKSGQRLPPIVVCAKTLRIVDGFHRRRAALRHFGADASIDVELRDYKTEADLFLDAVALNSTHGRKLDAHDRTRIILRLREFQVPDQRIAIVLHIEEPKVQQLAIRIVHGPDGTAHPNKTGFSHLRGQTLTEGQIATVKSVRSGEVGRNCLELIKMLDSDVVDLTDERTVNLLRQLERTIGKVLGQT